MARLEPSSPDETPPSKRAASEPRRKLYRPPTLTVFGDVRDVTLGPSVGIGESGNPLVFKA